MEIYIKPVLKLGCMRVSVASSGSSEDRYHAELLKGLLVKAGCALSPDGIRVLAASGLACLPLLTQEKTLLVGTFSKADMENIREKSEEVAFLSAHNLPQIVDAVENLSHGILLDVLTETKEAVFDLPRIRENPAIGLLKIQHTHLGTWISHPIEVVMSEAKNAIADGCKELVLIGDAIRYGTEKIWRSSLPDILKELADISGDFKVRLESCNAKDLKPVMDEIMQWMQQDKAYKHLHIPLLSGSNDLLQQMGKQHSVEDAKALAHRFKSEFGRGTFSTEFVVGFGDETVAQFNDSLEVLGELRPEMVAVEQASTGKIIDDRVRIIMSNFHHILRMNNEKWLGWQGDITLFEKGERDEWVGRNFAWKPINVKGSFMPGDRVHVQINAIIGDSIRGEVLR